jgi:hypothetical protein
VSEEQDRIDLPHKQARSEVGPAEDLRLADQMVCLSVISRVQDYTYWYFQFFSTGALSTTNLFQGPLTPGREWGGLSELCLSQNGPLGGRIPGHIS